MTYLLVNLKFITFFKLQVKYSLISNPLFFLDVSVQSEYFISQEFNLVNFLNMTIFFLLAIFFLTFQMCFFK